MASTSSIESDREESHLLLPAIIDRRARLEPDRLFCILLDTDAKGGISQVNRVTYKDYANAINICARWLQSTLGKDLESSVLGYLGPPDIRYSIIALAAAKTNHKALLMSTRNSTEGQLKLLDTLHCGILLTAKDFPALNPLSELLASQRKLQVVPFESIQYWIGQPNVPEYPFSGTLEKDGNQPFAILHTSGSTGLPKPIVYTFEALTTYRTWLEPHNIESGSQPKTVDRWKNKIHYVAFPISHMAGLLSLTALNVYWNMPSILGPATVLPTPALVAEIHALDICEASILPPSLIEPLAKYPDVLEGLRKLDHIIWCGAAFSSSIISDKISSVVPIYAAYGSTETGPFPLIMESQEYHDYMTFSPLVGAHFRHYAEDLYELVIVKDEKLRAYQKIFFTFPHLTEWASKDLMSKHPTQENMWKYRGRTDDILVLLNGTNVNPVLMEGIVMTHPKVVSAILTGTGKVATAWLIEATNPPENSDDTTALLEDLWPTIIEANNAAQNGRVTKDKILFTTKAKPMLRAGKGTVQRARTLEIYRQDLDSLYD